MQGFSAILGQSGAVEILKAALESGRIAHAYLFNGPRGVGKRLTATVFARALNCQAGSGKPCDRCIACQKAVNGNHPDLMYLRPEGNSFRIEQVRALQKSVYAKVYEGMHKVYVIEDAHKATIQASNSLLKTLEEPPPGCVFILVTENPQALPPTILSRCQRVNFAPLDRDVMRGLLMDRGLPPEQVGLAVNLANGSLGEALEIIDNQKISQARHLAVDFIQAAFGKSYYRRFKLIEAVDKEKIDPQLFLEQLLSLLRDLYFMLSGGGQRIVHIDLIENLQGMAVDREKVESALKLVLEAGEFQRKQANTKLLFDVLGCRLAKLV